MYQDLAEAIEDIQEKGYEHLFEVDEKSLKCKQLDQSFKISDLHIVSSFHFDQGTDPGDDSVLYLVETVSGIKGYLVAGSIIYKDREKAAFLDQLLHNR